jgi:branched-chain amino acid transport system substrate-binding protein
MAAMPVQFEKNVINFFPITAAREMYEPFHRLKYANAATYYDQMRIAVPKLVKEKGAKKVCTIYQDDEFGLEVLRGAEAGLKTIGMSCREDLLQARRHRLLVAGRPHEGRRLRHGGAGHHHPRDHRHHRRGAQDRLQPGLPGLQRGLHRPDPQAGRQGHGRPVRHHDVQNPYLDEASQPMRFWANKYKTKFNEDPTVFSVYGYGIIDNFIKRRQKAGPNLSTDSFIKSMDSMTSAPTCSAARN